MDSRLSAFVASAPDMAAIEQFLRDSEAHQVLGAISEFARLGLLKPTPYYGEGGLRDRDDWDECWVSRRPDTWAGPPTDEDGNVDPPAPLGTLSYRDSQWSVAIEDGYTLLRVPKSLTAACYIASDVIGGMIEQFILTNDVQVAGVIADWISDRGDEFSASLWRGVYDGTHTVSGVANPTLMFTH